MPQAPCGYGMYTCTIMHVHICTCTQVHMYLYPHVRYRVYPSQPGCIPNGTTYVRHSTRSYVTMAINMNAAKGKKAGKAEQRESNLQSYKEVAPLVTPSRIIMEFTDDETGETYTAEMPVSSVMNSHGLVDSGVDKSEGFWYGAALQLDTPHGKVKFNAAGNCLVSGSKEAHKARASKAARQRAAEADRE